MMGIVDGRSDLNADTPLHAGDLLACLRHEGLSTVLQEESNHGNYA